MDPQQVLFSLLKTSLENAGYDVYEDGLPPKNTPYPFIYLGNTQQIDDILKHGITGYIYQTVHVWSNKPRERGTFSNILFDVKNVASNIGESKGFSFMLENVDQTILPDNTTDVPLLHGVLDLKFDY